MTTAGRAAKPPLPGRAGIALGVLALALFLAAQPVLWMSNVAYAQAIDQGLGLTQQDARSQQGALGSQQLTPLQMQQLQQGGATGLGGPGDGRGVH